MRLTITSKINILVIVTVVVTSISLSVLLRQGYIKKERHDIEEHIMDISRIRSAHFIEHILRGDYAVLHREISTDLAALKHIVNMRIYDGSGRLLVDKDGAGARTSVDGRIRKWVKSKDMVHQWDDATFVHFEPVIHENTVIAFLLLEYDAAHFFQGLTDLESYFVLITGVLTLIFIMTGIIFSESLNEPLVALTNAAKRIAGGDHSVKVRVASKDELGMLAEHFNAMVGKLEAEIRERRKAEEFIRNILRNIDEGFVVIDRDYRIVAANNAYCEHVKASCESIQGRFCYEVSHRLREPCFLTGEECPVRHTFETGEPCRAVHEHRNSKGEPVHIETKSYPLRDESGEVVLVIEIVIDVTERKKLESQLLHAQKMESIGTLAGGIAHDFNNILTAIIGCGKLLNMKLGDASSLSTYVSQILVSASKAATLTQGLLAFSRKQSIEPRPADLGTIIRNVEGLLLRLIGEEVELRVSVGEDDLTVLADGNQMEQVLMNLATNARDAMPTGGILTISTGRVRIDEQFVKAHGYGRGGEYALVSVADTGVGMDEKTRERIFEPFFTTKDAGRGTGLGLSIAYGIIKQHSGYINVCSEPGKGASFNIYLPAAESETRKADAAAHIPVQGGAETILIAEDEAGVRRTTRAVLEEFGYSIIEAADGEDAMLKFMESKDKVQLLLLDLVMPKKGGREVYDELKALRPDIKAIFTSGYTEAVMHERGYLEAGVTFIPKPVLPEDLLKIVREALDT